MDGSNELRQIAHVLRCAAITARDIGKLRTSDADEIAHLSQLAEMVADKFDTIAAGGSRDGASGHAKAG